MLFVFIKDTRLSEANLATMANEKARKLKNVRLKKRIITQLSHFVFI